MLPMTCQLLQKEYCRKKIQHTNLQTINDLKLNFLWNITGYLVVATLQEMYVTKVIIIYWPSLQWMAAPNLSSQENYAS